MNFPFIKSTDGKKSASLTISLTAFILVAVWFLISFLNLKIGGWQPREFNDTSALAFLSPCLLLYFSRRKSEDEKQSPENTKED
jgi:hypothetical protein